MTTAAPTPELDTRSWGMSLPHVRRALKFIKAKGAVTAEQLVEWDAAHGRRLFTWDDPAAADGWRLYQARLFLNRFRAKFEGMRVRAFIHVHQDEAAGIDQDAYYSVEAISQNPAMREQILRDIMNRMANLASELKMWKLTETERAGLFDRLRVAME